MKIRTLKVMRFKVVARLVVSSLALCIVLTLFGLLFVAPHESIRWGRFCLRVLIAVGCIFDIVFQIRNLKRIKRLSYMKNNLLNG